MNENQDFELMKSQLDALKAKLDEQKLVSDKMMERIIREKASFLNIVDIVCIAVLIVCVPVILYVFPRYGLSWWFTGYTLIMIIASAIYTIINRKLANNYLRNGSLAEYSSRMAKTKKRFILEVCVSWILTAVLFALSFYEFLTRMDPSASFLMRSIIATLIGIALGIYITFKQWKALNALIEQIDDLKKRQ